MDSNILARAKAWASNPLIDEASRQEIQSLIDSENYQELKERFVCDLEFGTGGMRSFYQAGTNRINRTTIRRAAYAVAIAVKEAYPELQSPRVALSYDSRHGSIELAREAACVFAAAGVEAFLYERMNPVPLLSFSVRYHQAQAGVMVTASHNPKEYNGFKVYWSDGAQVTPPHDRIIIAHYAKLSDLSLIPQMSFEEALEKNLIHMVKEDVEIAYTEAIKKWSVNPDLAQERGHELKIVYTPIHGTGLIPCLAALKAHGFSNVLVPEAQKLPHGDFPTVKSPNPENPEALSMAVELMKEQQGSIVFGSDPDGDRLGIALEHEGQIVYPNGNQIGTLMLYYILENKKQRGTLKLPSYMVKTIVTTPLLETIARHYGVESFDTLTGFKWICGKMNEIEKNSPEKNFLFATEESFGYLNHDNVRDKDGISSVVLASEMALWYKSQGLNLMEALDVIYEKFGFSHETLLSLDYFGLEGAAKINRIMDRFRALKNQALAEVQILVSEDYLSLARTSRNGTNEALAHAKSNVLGFNLETGDKIYLRPSGTEPKIKFYIMIHEPHGNLVEKKARARERTERYLEFIRHNAEEA
jgi:phosphoglucomutase